MTPQQRLQEAKDQAAKECGWLSWESAEQGNFESSADRDDESQILHRAAEIMYEAGKYDTVQNDYTSSIEEAKNKAAREWNDNFDYIAIRNGVQVGNIKMLHLDRVNDRALRLMYEAGKKEGDTVGWNNGYSAGSRDERKHTDNALKQEETYRKALEDLLDSLDLPADSEERAAEISIMKRKIQNALKP